MFDDWVLNTPLLPVNNKLYMENLKLYGLFLTPCSTVSRVQSHYKDIVYFLPLSPYEFLVVI